MESEIARANQATVENSDKNVNNINNNKDLENQKADVDGVHQKSIEDDIQEQKASECVTEKSDEAQKEESEAIAADVLPPQKVARKKSISSDKTQTSPSEDSKLVASESFSPPEKYVRKKQRQKRRILHGNVKREPTPIRYLGDEPNEEAKENVKGTSVYPNGKEISSSSTTTSENNSRQGSFRKGHAKKNSLPEIAHQEIINIISKTKKSITSAAQKGRERFRKYEKQLVKRSQSVPRSMESTPYKFAEELQESLQRVQQSEHLLRRKFSDPILDGNLLLSVSPVRRHQRNRSFGSEGITSPKIIEVLDPKTSRVLQRKSITYPSKQIPLSPLKSSSLKDLYRNFKIHKSQFHKDYTRLKRTFHRCCCELFLIVMLCGCGGLLFKYTEGAFESFYKCGVKRVKRDFIDLLWTKSHNLREDDWKSLARNRLRMFEEELHSAHEAGMTDYSGIRAWSFLNAIVYCLTIVTTIGYGHMFPKTHTGRALTIVYALIGIPLFLIALTDFGKLFTRAIKFVWSFVRRLYYTGNCRKVRKNSGVDDMFKGAQNLYDYATNRRPSLFDPNTPLPDPENQTQTTDTPTTPAISNFEIDDEFNLPISVALFILVAYIFCGAVLYMAFEGWDFFESFYFVFISMSTIGFGDYVPRDPAFMIVSIVYLVFGLALMSMCINVVQAKLSDTFKKASSKIGATMGLEVEEEAMDEENEDVTTLAPVNVEKTNELPNGKS